jgi:hypothetical protein
VQELLLRLHACCHGLALAGIVAGVTADAAVLVRAGSVLGLIGGCAFAAFTLGVLRGLGPGGARQPAGVAGRRAV